jgi:heat-inducible transcriptional repressor
VLAVKHARPTEGSDDGKAETLSEAGERGARALLPSASSKDGDRPFGGPQHLLQLGHLAETRPDRRGFGPRGVARRRPFGQHVFGQRDHDRTGPPLHGEMERPVNYLRDLGRGLDLRRPFRGGCKDGAVVHLLKCAASQHRPVDLADEQDHRRGIMLGDVHAVRGVHGARTSRDKANSGPSCKASLGQRHHGRAAFLPADHDLDWGVMQCVERRKKGFARNAVNALNALGDELVDQDPAAGSQDISTHRLGFSFLLCHVCQFEPSFSIGGGNPASPCATPDFRPFFGMATVSERPVESSALAIMNARSREIFRNIVESYLATGEPVGSRHLSRMLPISLSPASVRNVMQDLEELGLIYAPHASAGRLPTHQGLRLFVDALLEFGDLGREERARIDNQVRAAAEGGGFEGAIAETTSLISSLTGGAGVVLTTKTDVRLKHVEFVRLESDKALAILVAEDATIENRVVATPVGMPASALVEASNYLNARVQGRTLSEVRAEIEASRSSARQELDEIAARLVEAGLASWSGSSESRDQLIVRGQANLLGDVRAAEDLERVRTLFADLETKTDVIDLLHRAEAGEGVKIFIGSENKLFSLSGSAMIAAPLRDGAHRIAGVLGVIGPTRRNYGRIVPMVEYAAQVLGELKRPR